jgi:hypothetical protein
MKQSAVDFLISHLQKSKDFQRVLNEVSQMSTIEFDLINQAKAMEREQMIKFANDYLDDDADLTAEEYYNETYGGEK